MIHGGLFVMTTGQQLMPMCCVNRLDTLDRVYHNFADLAIQSSFHKSLYCAILQMPLHTVEHSSVKDQHK
jgi:hypothetical protein